MSEVHPSHFGVGNLMEAIFEALCYVDGDLWVFDSDVGWLCLARDVPSAD
jgi:hypothetical protein